eukprot:m.606906 g.606906  ORF g.606906 m.606906 type:complete len:68 (-) comp22474_c0_seq19:1489-1692(-)
MDCVTGTTTEPDTFNRVLEEDVGLPQDSIARNVRREIMKFKRLAQGVLPAGAFVAVPDHTHCTQAIT